MGAVITSLIYGRDADMNDPKEQEVVKYSAELLDEAMGMFLLSMLPWLAPFFHFRRQRQRKEAIRYTDYIEKLILEHEYDGGEVRSIADALKKASAETPDEDLVAAGIERRELLLVAIDLYTAGMFDTAENSVWLLVLLAAHPEFQERLYQDIIRVTGGSRHVQSADQNDLSLGWAAVLETFRFGTSTPFAMPHSLMEDMQVDKYTIPAGVQIAGQQIPYRQTCTCGRRKGVQEMCGRCTITQSSFLIRTNFCRTDSFLTERSTPNSTTRLWHSALVDVVALARVSRSRKSSASASISFRTSRLSWTQVAWSTLASEKVPGSRNFIFRHSW